MHDEIDEKTLKKLHDVHLELLSKFAKICDKHSLNYSLAYGTLLGAVRHKGFIPWDDDLDIFMPRDDYEKFLEIGQAELGNKYYLDYFKNNDFYLQFAKIKKNGTIFDEKMSHHLNNHKGIFIDIFPLDNVNKNNRFAHLRAVLIRCITSTINVKKKFTKLSNERHQLIISILRVFSHKALMRFQKKLSINKNTNAKYMVSYYSVYSYKKELFEKTDFFPTTHLEFEGKDYQVMKNYDKFLTQLYGNYMELPPVEKRINHKPLKIDFGDEK